MVDKILAIEIIIVGIFLVFVFVRTITRKKEKIKKVNFSDSSNKDNPYEGLRKMAFNMNIRELGLSLDDSEIFGVIMDWDIGSGIVTLVAYKTGDASIYLSSGGGVIGGGPNPEVNKAAILFVEKAKKFFNKSKRLYTFPLPDKNSVRFYFLTSSGKFYFQENMLAIENQTSPYYDYFTEANNLIAELRKTVENIE